MKIFTQARGKLWAYFQRNFIPKFNLIFIFLMSSFLQLSLAADARSVTLDMPPITVRGKVTDQSGGALPGVSVRLKGSSTAATTDNEGMYTINVPDGSGILEFRYIGYAPAEIDINGRNVVNITLNAETTDLSEVVVVGYGTQKKVNLTGAISTVSSKEIGMRPVGQTSAALQGIAPGVTVTQASGRPGGDAATIRIRGIGTLSDANPLVLIDGIEGSMNNIDPNVIESVSILKDAASASIYGSRAANGVILVTTKRGSTEIGINYNNYLGWQSPTNMPKVVNALDHMSLMNEAYTNVGRTPLYANALLEQYHAQGGVSSDEFPNTGWQDAVLTGSGFQQSHFVTVNGGSEKVRMLASAGYFDQKGIIENSGFKRFTIRNNTDITISKKLSAKLDLQYVKAVTTEPAVGTANIFNYMNGIPASQLGVNSNGTWGVGWNGLNPIAASIDGGTNQTTGPFGSINASLNYHPVDWLSAEVTVAPKYAETIRKNFNKSIQTFLPDGTPSFKTPALTSLTESSNRTVFNNMRASLTADKTFNTHNVKVLLGASQEDFYDDFVSAFRDTYILPDYPVIDAGSAVNQQTGGSSEEWALRSFFGRLNYDYKSKYLLEINGRYDGSSRFNEGNRYAFFPSASAGWRISEETFMQPLKKVINELKFRASWGRLGNQNIGTYPAASLIALGSATLGNQIVNIAALNNLSNRDISWETTEMTDIGVDMVLFTNITLTADYYIRKTKDILLNLNIPLIIGLGAPAQNAGMVENKGWELGIGYKNNINEFRYNLNFNLSDVKNKVVDLKGINQTGLTVSREGYAINSVFGYEAEGFFNDAAEVAAHARQFGAVAPGDIKYKDQNQDGIINESDKIVLGTSIPRYTFGANLNASYKGIDAGVFVQGVGKGNGYLFGPGIMPFSVGNLGGTILEQNKDRWTPENPNATYPRLAFGESNNEQASSFWMKDAAYIRLKNVQLGYTFPVGLTRKIGVKNLRLFANGSNLFTKDNFWGGFDVESPIGTVSVYPQVKVYSFGLNANF
ncbi:SusC/RagA family TonB-linked outer membrane protein [Pedobacter immunditicola]|uniref:SusC/RagA family TonB-linked outer membrane protein n=1 Tax=Pedobacter immunditicola TaxID=3133440 RepID=UPI0030B23A35